MSAMAHTDHWGPTAEHRLRLAATPLLQIVHNHHNSRASQHGHVKVVGSQYI